MTFGFSSQRLKRLILLGYPLPQTATLVFLGLVTLITVLSLAWLNGEPNITKFFNLLCNFQNNPPWWSEVPELSPKYLLLPTLIFSGIAAIIIKVSPQPQTWTRALIISINLAIILRYLLWRGITTLNLTHPVAGILSLGLFLAELLMLLLSSLQLYLSLKIKDNKSEVNPLAKDIIETRYTPSVDIFIPSYDEPEFIIKRTIIGCQALDYPHKKIYLLDDTRRPEIKKLAKTLGCQYITRVDNLYAKAGNLNHALMQTKGELIVVFDADFIPTKNFINRTIGFFQDSQIALVQTPQTYYNFDPIARNLGLENQLLPDEEQFYRQLELIKNSVGSTVCSGTSFVVRRSALESIGGFVTESICEDYFTGIQLTAKGYRLVYLNEKLSAGLAAENINAHLTQRERWGQGTLQAFFIKSNPLTIPGLTLVQRLAHLEGLASWFMFGLRIYLLIMPLIYAFFNILPVQASLDEWLYFFTPIYFFQMITFSWFNYHSRSFIFNEICSIQHCFQLGLMVFNTILNPFNQGFKVTPKGIIQDRYNWNHNLALPLIGFWILTALAVLKITILGTPEIDEINTESGISLGIIWGVYNLIIITLSILMTIDAPKPDHYDWFELRRVVQIQIQNQTLWGITTQVSEAGAEIDITTQYPLDFSTQQTIKLDWVEENLSLQGHIKTFDYKGDNLTLQVEFEAVSLSQYRQLIELLFCRPGQWKNQKVPGELRSLFLVFRALIKPRFLFDKKPKIKAMKVSQF
ncbi:glycosyltransferase family 2 protein [Planktothrix pseudagardhii]|uniref:Cellulose synthase 1 catalytic subunit [UDP-forming] n=1 Tax=Planktothrix pseudagardhii TaxID=132604 RepID=A0A9W4D9S1_9CYAN|nr:glycosyltransferase [Planktothrix pseudagardhii]CAD5967543.1 Cellulose synthase 1 catalytic subunit [UDP-forming] [Planktothrix pseudagardhii]